MILRYRDIKKRNSNFVYDLLTSTKIEKVKEIIGKDPDLLHFNLTINDVEVPITTLERMYKQLDDVVEIRAKHKALKMLEKLKYTLADTFREEIEQVTDKLDDNIINYVDELQIVGQENAVEEGTREDTETTPGNDESGRDIDILGQSLGEY